MILHDKERTKSGHINYEFLMLSDFSLMQKAFLMECTHINLAANSARTCISLTFECLVFSVCFERSKLRIHGFGVEQQIPFHLLATVSWNSLGNVNFSASLRKPSFVFTNQRYCINLQWKR